MTEGYFVEKNFAGYNIMFNDEALDAMRRCRLKPLLFINVMMKIIMFARSKRLLSTRLEAARPATLLITCCECIMFSDTNKEMSKKKTQK